MIDHKKDIREGFRPNSWIIPVRINMFCFRLTGLSLGGNPFDCSCEILWFQQWMQSKPHLFKDFRNVGYRCANLHNMTVSDFSINPQVFLSTIRIYYVESPSSFNDNDDNTKLWPSCSAIFLAAGKCYRYILTELILAQVDNKRGWKNPNRKSNEHSSRSTGVQTC